MSDHVVAIVQARLGSVRFPRKVLADLAGRPLILHVMERAAAIPGVHTTIAAIPHGEPDLAAVLTEAGWPAFEGPEDDVLRRYALAAAVSGATRIVRVTGDCPLLAPEVGGTLLRRCSVYGSSTAGDGGVDGFDTEVMARWLLDAADQSCDDPAEREHVTAWLRRTLQIGLAQNVVEFFPFTLKLSVDTVDDLLTVRRIAEQLEPGQFAMEATLIAAARSGVWSVAHV